MDEQNETLTTWVIFRSIIVAPDIFICRYEEIKWDIKGLKPSLINQFGYPYVPLKIQS